MKTINLLIAATAFAVAISSCRKEEITAQQQSLSPHNMDSPSDPPGARTIQMNSTPAQNASEIEEMNVEMERVEAYTEDEGWIILNEEAQIISFTDAELDANAWIADVPEDVFKKIKKIRLTFGSDNQLELFGAGSILNLDFQGSHTEEIEIKQGELHQQSEIVLQIDFGQSLMENLLGFTFNPVIRHLEDPETGISGSVSGVSQALIRIEGQSGGSSLRTFLNAEGEFMIRDMEAGTYRLIVKPITEGLQEFEERSSTIVVVDGRITSAQTISFN